MLANSKCVIQIQVPYYRFKDYPSYMAYANVLSQFGDMGHPTKKIGNLQCLEILAKN